MTPCRPLLLASVALSAAISLCSCSSTPGSGTAKSSTPTSGNATPTVTDPNASVVAQVDCGEDGVANVRVTYGTAPPEEVLVGRNSTTLANGGIKTFSSHYGTAAGYEDATLAVTTSPTTGTCKTTLTDYNSGNLIAQRESAGKVTLTVVVSTGRTASTSTTTASPTAPRGFVSEATWTDGPWPLTVPEGTLACESLGGRLGRVTITANGTTYWVNGLAKGTHRFADLDEIWRADPSFPAIKVNIGPLLDRGLALC